MSDVCDTVYSLTSVCEGECAVLPLGQRLGDPGDTIGCREAEAARADQSSSSACIAAGPSGGGVCGTRCDAYCKLVFAVCIDANRGAQNPFTSMNDCMRKCAAFTFDTKAPEFDSTNHNTLNCRQYQLQQALTDSAGGAAFDDCPYLGVDSGACKAK